MVSGYLLGFAALLITAGSLATGPAASGCSWRRWRLRRASPAAGLPRRPAELTAARVVQDAGAAVTAPQVLATFRVIFSGRERGKALALYRAMAGFASAIRLILGGVLSDANLFGWRWRAVFFLNVPVALVTLAMTAETAGGASGLSSTAQQLGSAIGMALPGTIFYGWVTTGHTFAQPTSTGRRTRSGAFAMCAALSLLLPHTPSRGHYSGDGDIKEQPKG